MDPDVLITEVAKRHGVALGQDDPVMILATLNELLAEENARSQAEILRRFKLELSSLSKALAKEAEAKVQTLLSETLESHRKALARFVEEQRESLMEEIHTVRSADLQEFRLSRLVTLNLMMSVATTFLVALSWLV